MNRPIWALALAVLAIAPLSSSAQAQPAYGSTNIDQSAFALGSVDLNVIFLESDGRTDANKENWTAAQLSTLHGEIDEAVEFWQGLTAGYHPNARLKIHVNYVNDGVPLPTRYEPITRNSSDDRLWINDALSTLGYTSGSHFTNVRNFNQDRRSADETNWATTMFVVNDELDLDNRFADSQFAYSYVGGPYMVFTYGNNGWNPSRFNHPLSHEFAHQFFALDEYYETGRRNNERSGYLNGINGNAEINAGGARVTPPQPNALMLNNTLVPSPFTLVQVGIKDADGDGIPDILDVPPILSGDASLSNDVLGTFAFIGAAEVGTLPNRNNQYVGFSNSQQDMTINWIASAEYNLDESGWLPIPAADEYYGGYAESLLLTVNGLSGGDHRIDVRAINSVDLPSNVLSFPFHSALPVPEPSTGVLALLGGIGLLTAARRTRHRHIATTNRLSRG